MDDASRQGVPQTAGARERSVESETAWSAERWKIGVLVVDDDALVRSMLHATLRHHGFAVRLAADGEEALEVYRRHERDIDLVLLDVRMPRLDGPRTLAALERINPSICCCFMTGDLGSYTEDELLQMHAARVFQKPFETENLAQNIEQLVRARRTGDACAPEVRNGGADISVRPVQADRNVRPT